MPTTNEIARANAPADFPSPRTASQMLPPPPASGKRGGSKAHKCLAYARFPAKTINRPHGTGAAFSFSLRGRWLPNWVAPLGSGIEHLSNEVVL
jgi:hypothetical protein